MEAINETLNLANYEFSLSLYAVGIILLLIINMNIYFEFFYRN